MQKIKKILAMGLATIMAVSVIGTTVFADDKFVEWNTTPSEWAQADVTAAADLGILPADIAGYIYEISREHFCDILFNMLSVTGIAAVKEECENTFNDVDNNSINFLANAGIIHGYTENEFKPDKNITREEAAVILNRTMNYCHITQLQETSVTTFNDDEFISEWAKNSVYNIASMKVMIGDDNGNFNPNSYYTTEESIVSIMRMYNLLF